MLIKRGCLPSVGLSTEDFCGRDDLRFISGGGFVIGEDSGVGDGGNLATGFCKPSANRANRMKQSSA